MPEASKTAKLLFLTTADTEILAAARATELLPEGFPEILCCNPATLEDAGRFFDRALPGTRAVMVRLLGGEGEPDAEVTGLSTAPSGVVAEAFEYLRCGGISNTANLLRFVADTLLLEGYGFEPPSPLPELGVYHPEGSFLEELLALHEEERPTVGVVFYRTHLLGGNTGFVDALVEALEGAGV